MQQASILSRAYAPSSMDRFMDIILPQSMRVALPALAPRALRVGFAAETAALASEARRKLEAKGAHLLVANDVARADIGFGSEANEVTVFRAGGEPIFFGRRPKGELARDLFDLFAQELRALRREALAAPR